MDICSELPIREIGVSENPFIGSAVAARLTSYLEHLGISEGETMHSFRSGCSITLSMLGVPVADIARHVGWKSIQMAQYYSQTDKVLALTKPADALAASTSPCEEARFFRTISILRSQSNPVLSNQSTKSSKSSKSQSATVPAASSLPIATDDTASSALSFDQQLQLIKLQKDKLELELKVLTISRQKRPSENNACRSLKSRCCRNHRATMQQA
ncbi:hypothetical protein OS493_033224 [Desmophyllum pertusum]|uniref:Tyr recombinase domain-containing protein n=1 Tax=Desmophyllum pertusum TaxID=174260 RepID=A0A9X0CEJ8_9CNID|nr:hypothetical protein OS493_033224 [Desmophyllum pertusum]